MGYNSKYKELKEAAIRSSKRANLEIKLRNEQFKNRFKIDMSELPNILYLIGSICFFAGTLLNMLKK